MTISEKASAYLEAGRIVYQAKLDVVYLDVAWEKVRRIESYLNAQAKSELGEALS